jgi:hypothetical protein
LYVLGDQRRRIFLKYAILIYGSEALTEQLSPAARAALLDGHRELQAELARRGEFATVQLMPSTSAVSLRRSSSRQEPVEPIVTDGPFSETKEQFLGFYVAEFATLDEAIALARSIASPQVTLEIRPISWVGGIMGRL